MSLKQAEWRTGIKVQFSSFHFQHKLIAILILIKKTDVGFELKVFLFFSSLAVTIEAECTFIIYVHSEFLFFIKPD